VSGSLGLPAGVRRLLAPNPSSMTGQGTNSYLVGEREVAVVDPGPASPAHVEALLAAAPPGGRVAAILVTHGHGDHTGAVAGLKARTGAPVLGHADLPGVDRPLGDGERLTVDGRELAVLGTPGHAEDHLCFWLSDARALFAGDLVAGVGTVVLSELPGTLGRYLASLQKLLALGPFTLLPGHGPAVPDGPAKVREYLAHRATREAQIVAALADGPATVEALVARIYRDTPTSLHAMAARNVRAHLELLEAKGQVQVTDGLWALLR